MWAYGVELWLAVFRTLQAPNCQASPPIAKSNEEPDVYLHQSETASDNVGIASVLRSVRASIHECGIKRSRNVGSLTPPAHLTLSAAELRRAPADLTAFSEGRFSWAQLSHVIRRCLSLSLAMASTGRSYCFQWRAIQLGSAQPRGSSTWRAPVDLTASSEGRFS